MTVARPARFKTARGFERLFFGFDRMTSDLARRGASRVPGLRSLSPDRFSIVGNMRSLRVAGAASADAVRRTRAATDRFMADSARRGDLFRLWERGETVQMPRADDADLLGSHAYRSGRRTAGFAWDVARDARACFGESTGAFGSRLVRGGKVFAAMLRAVGLDKALPGRGFGMTRMVNYLLSHLDTNGQISLLERVGAELAKKEPNFQALHMQIYRQLVELTRSGGHRYLDINKLRVVNRIQEAVRGPIFVRGSATTPDKTPWGGYRGAKWKGEGRRQVGEYWELSSDATFPSRVRVNVDGRNIEVPLTIAGDLFPVQVYGAESQNRLPYLYKILTSGEWGGRYLPQLNRMLDSFNGQPFGEAARSEFSVKDLKEIVDGKNYHEILISLGRLISFLDKQGHEVESAKLAVLYRQMRSKALSFQLHPAPEDVRERPEFEPKVEAWEVLEAEAGAGVWVGLADGFTLERLFRELETGGDVLRMMQFVPVKKGDTLIIPYGTIHAIGPGLMLAEPQTAVSSNKTSTLRLFDHGRIGADGKPRELHIADAKWVLERAHERGAVQGSALLDQVRITPEKSGLDAFGMATVYKLYKGEFGYHRIVFKRAEDVYEPVLTTEQFIQNDTPIGYEVISGSVTVYDYDGSVAGTASQGDIFMAWDAQQGFEGFKVVANEAGTELRRID